jgi:hypothetical protein
MRKLMVVMLGLGLVTGTVATTFAQGTKKEETAGKKNKSPKKSKKKEDTEKKGGR